ncbi:MAG TPA: methionyl-tRNA formyltransferase [Candidatus Aquilonibacter sp.]|nr:methionyl-tRNA formyltransferase [Candidatus Aquilonibacter sp.]
MRTLFFGTSAFAVPSLHVLAAKTQVVGVVTQPDRPSGRGHKLQPTPVKAAALDLSLRVFEPTKLKSFAQELEGAFDLFALASYGRILPQALLDLPRLGALNVHPSLLPRYRGATPIQTALRNGDAETGVTIMLMDAGMDTGDIVLQERVPIEPADDYGALHDRLALYGGELLGEAIDLAIKGELTHRAQSGEPVITKPISKDDLLVDPSWPPQRIIDAVRAFSPSPGARMEIDGETIKVLRAHVEAGAVVLDEVIAPNRGRMSGEAYRQSRRDRENA